MTTVGVGVRLTSYTSDDEKWVIQTVSKYQKHGVSLKKLCRVSLQLHNTHRWHKQMSEMPPGREKITEIVRKGNGIHWKVEKSAGGKSGGTHTIHPLKINHLRAVERITYGLSYGTMIEKLNSFNKMGDVSILEANVGRKERRFKRKDFFDYVALKDEMLRFPMRIFQARGHIGSDKEDLFKAMVSDIRKHITTMRKIEDDQKSLNKKFPKILEYVEVLREKNVEDLIFKVPKKDIPKPIIGQMNALRRLM